MSIIEQLLRIIAPHNCLGCGREGYVLCLACAQALPQPLGACYRCGATANNNICPACQAKTGVAAALSFTRYEGLAKEAVYKLKFDRAAAAAADIAGALAARFAPAAYANAVTYVPTAPARIRTRGYDQAALIARALAKRASLPCYALLGRSHGHRQVGQNRAARHAQASHAFYIRKPSDAANRRILLIDDVLTTGATCEAATAALLKAEAASVVLLTFAAAPRPARP